MAPASHSVPGERPSYLVSPVGVPGLISESPSPIAYVLFDFMVFVLLFGSSGSVCKPRFSFPYSCTVFMNVFPVGFQIRCWGAHLSSAVSKCSDA